MNHDRTPSSSGEEDTAIRELSDSAMESLELGILMVNAEGQVQFVNSAFRTLYGLSGMVLQGKSWEDLQESAGFRESDPALPYILSRCFDLTETGFQEQRSLQKPAPKHLAITARKVTSRADCLLGKFSIHADITRQMEIQQQILERNQELEKADRQVRAAQSQLVQSEKMAGLGMLVAGIAHEINTPMGAINSNSDILERLVGKVRDTLKKAEPQDPLPAAEELRKLLELIEQTAAQNRMACERILLLVRSLRNFTRLDKSDRKKADLQEGLESTLILVRHQFKNRIHVVREYGELPEILCYPNQLNQVFMNLFINAAQAMPEGGTLSIRTRAEAGLVKIEVSDTGMGIPPENLARIFEPGFTTKRMGIGTGLGLSICEQIVGDHQGKIEAHSEPGKGTTFLLSLPIQ